MNFHLLCALRWGEAIYAQMEREDFLSAAIYNNRPFIEEWLKGQPEEAVDIQLLGELLRKAAQYGSATVVELLVDHGTCGINHSVTLIFSFAKDALYYNPYL